MSFALKEEGVRCRYLVEISSKGLALEHRNDSNCKLCYKRGYQGVNQNNLLVPCSKCVDNDGLMESWRTYVRETPELKELYGDYFEAEVEEGEEEKT